MSTDTINRPLFKALSHLGIPADDAMDAATGFVTSGGLEKLATKDDLALLESRLTIKMVLFVGGALVVLTQVVPPGKLFQLISGLVTHLTG